MCSSRMAPSTSNLPMVTSHLAPLVLRTSKPSAPVPTRSKPTVPSTSAAALGLITHYRGIPLLQGLVSVRRASVPTAYGYPRDLSTETPVSGLPSLSSSRGFSACFYFEPPSPLEDIEEHEGDIQSVFSLSVQGSSPHHYRNPCFDKDPRPCQGWWDQS